MPYLQTTLLELRSEVARRLDDLSFVFWTAPEIDSYINEALQTWQAFSGYWQEKGEIITSINQQWIDFPPLLKGPASELIINYLISDRTLINSLQYALLEPITLGADWGQPWQGTKQFSFEKLLAQTQQSVDAFNRDAALFLKRISIVATPGDNKIPLPQDYLEIARGSWISLDVALNQIYDPMRPSDRLSLQSFTKPLELSKPYAYEPYLAPLPNLFIYPAPNDVGSFELIYIPSQDGLDPQTIETTIKLPSDLIWMIKYSALYSLLQSDGQTRDPWRAEYCKSRYDDAMIVARNFSSILAAQINLYPARVSPVHDKDSFAPIWKDNKGFPEEILTAGWNLIHLTPIPIATNEVPDGKYSIELFVTKNAPRVVNDGDIVDLNPALIDIIEDFACHIALFKTSGAEFAKSFFAYKNLLDHAMDYNMYLKSQARNLSIMKKRGTETQNAAMDRRNIDVEDLTAAKKGGG